MNRLNRSLNSHDGFSLIEVLIAVVVLATGLLALAALQASLTRSSAEAKTRGRIAAMLTAQMDEIRGTSPGGYDAIPIGSSTITCSGGAPAWLCKAESEANLATGSLTFTQNTEIWSSTVGGTTFTNTLPAKGSDPQFKRVLLGATWRGADNSSHSLGMTSEMSALALTNTPLPTPDPNSSSNVSPVVREDDPTEAGMIPIAIGDGSETAATNPKPIVVSGRNGSTLIETKFNVLTYRPSSGAVQVQQRVETTVVGCRCKYGNQSELEGIYVQNFRPTYWDGARYKAPELLGASRPAIAGPVDATQSDLCTDCCRDHHDESTDTVKFDAMRSGNFDHYKNSDLTNPVTVASGGEYNESCRVIRVDGFWRVATDERIEHFDYIGTASDGKDQVPDGAYTDNYEQFVIDQLSNMFASATPDSLTAEQRYALPPDKKPAQVAINANETRYLHSHALLVDHIEAPAKEKIDSVLGNCTKTNKIDCILPYLPFTTINLTELAAYSPSVAGVISVVSGGANFADSSIVQGLVKGLTTATDGQTAVANGKVTESNSALAGVLPIDPDDATLRPIAQQEYRVGNALPPVGEDFTVTLNDFAEIMHNATQLDDPGIKWKVVNQGACSAATSGGAPAAALCETDSSLSSAASVMVSSYNYRTTDTPTVSCTSGSKTVSNVPSPTPRPICNLYKVTAANASIGGAALNFNTIANPNKYNEETTINFGSIAPNDSVQITLSPVVPDGQLFGQQLSCTLTNNSKAISTVTWSDPCL
jgi:prepilin-type N-terminal cleavage/methylation domain-containing protein